MLAIEEMSMPKYCNDCDFVVDSMGYCERANEQIPNYDFYSETNERPDFCPLIEIGTCKNCKRYNRNEMFCTWHGGYLMQKCDPNYYCADFEKRGAENG